MPKGNTHKGTTNMKKPTIFEKIVSLNIAQDGMWVFFALLMCAYYDVPLYVALAPIAMSLVMYLIGMRMVQDYNKEIPRTSSAVIPGTNNRDDVDELLSTIADQNLGKSMYGNTHTVGSNIVYNNND
jgi:hypothetical protein